ncbi:hypothetical protein GTU71_02485 [Rathayibacter sp. VKM Ac-2762]|uniref:hypothetical protein n=1 Tax=Rathayibacter sp. VKM Ac-2762 TaxID=2609254 RepID=UPI00132EA253|nr:hypothetical protein [Rathayibacter sp. VKM Ac-2762]QHF19836.1 hypothetical protein GTU71_02485 [Rathayibacter sp. VKM Ac-2762]
MTSDAAHSGMREHMTDRLLRARRAHPLPQPTLEEAPVRGPRSSRDRDEARALRLAIAVITRNEDEWLRVNRQVWAAATAPGGIYAAWYLLGTGYDRVGRLIAQIEKDREKTVQALREQLALFEEDV